jgi:hypothetical protein
MNSQPPPQLVAAIERSTGLAGKRTRDVPELAAWRIKIRRNWYRIAELNLAAAIINVCAMAINSGWAHWASIAAFSTSFCLMFWCEFRARRMTRQLARPAALQLARDMSGILD